MTNVFQNQPAPEQQGEPSNESQNSEWQNKLRESGFNFETPEDIAKKAYNADQHIKNLETELEELREDLSKRLSAEELLKQADEQKKTEAEEATTPKLSQDDIANLVNKQLDERTKSELLQRNLQTANDKMVELYGDKAGEVVAQRAQQLGVTVDELAADAAKSPSKFFTLMGVDMKKQPSNSGPTKGNINPEALISNVGQNAKAGSYSYYRNLRRENPSLYHSAKIQREMHKAAQAHGPGWTNT